MTNLSISAKLKFYNSRSRKGDVSRVADMTGYSPSHVSNVIARRRSNDEIVNALYRISNRRSKNSKKMVRA